MVTPLPPEYSGRQDTTITHVSSSIRTPVFVDNGVLHGTYERATVLNATTTSITPPKSSDFQMVHDRTYRLSETQDGIRLNHPKSYGMNYTGAIMFNGEKLDSTTDTPPLLVVGTEDTDKRLVPHSVETDSIGTAMPLANMQSRRLSDLEFDEKRVRLGQTIGVGFRTTDGVQQMLKGALHNLNSFDVGFSFTGPRLQKSMLTDGADLRKHSTRFVARDFYGVGILQAMKFFGRYDGHTLYMDRFGNLMYAPSVFKITSRSMGDAKGVGDIKNKPLLGVVNQIVSEGQSRGLNDDNRTIMDDLEMQKQMGNIKTTTIYNPLIRTPTASRRGGAEALRANKKAQRVIKSEGHVNSWDLDPGDIVKYEAPSTGIMKSVAILNASHSVRKQDSDFTMMSNDPGIESIVAMAESKNDLEAGAGEDSAFLAPIIEMSTTGTANIYITPRVSTFTIGATQPRIHSGGKPDSNAGINRHAGMIIGHRPRSRYAVGNTRGAIGVGASLRATVASGVGMFTNELELTGGVTGHFPDSGQLLIEDVLGGTSKVITYTGKAGFPFTTFTGCTPVGALTPGSRVISARPRSHEMRVCRATREVVL